MKTLAFQNSNEVKDTSIVAYQSTNGSILKLQRMDKTWGFCNITDPRGVINHATAHDISPGYFQAPDMIVNGMLEKHMGIKIFLFDSFKEFLGWCQQVL